MSSSQIGDYNKSELFWFMWFRSIFTLGFVLQLTWRSKDSFLPPFLLVDKVNNYMFPRMEERIRNSRTAAGPAKPASAVSPPALCPNHRKVVGLINIYLHIAVDLLTQSHKRSLLGWCLYYYLLFIIYLYDCQNGVECAGHVPGHLGAHGHLAPTQPTPPRYLLTTKEGEIFLPLRMRFFLLLHFIQEYTPPFLQYWTLKNWYTSKHPWTIQKFNHNKCVV